MKSKLIKTITTLSILAFLMFSCSDKQTKKSIKVVEKKESIPNITRNVEFDSVFTTEHLYNDLSKINNYNLKYRREYKNGEFVKDYWTLSIYNKKTNQKIDSISQSIMSFGYDFQDFKNARSFITGKNKNKESADNDYGDIIIADLNFDSLEDIALINDVGGNGGRFYSYYIQQNNKFELNHFLTDSMTYFPTSFIKKNKQLVTYVHAGVCGLGEHKYTFNKKTNTWKEISHRIINICNE